MNNHEIWIRCSICSYFYDIRIDIICPICLTHEKFKRRNETVQRIPGPDVIKKVANVRGREFEGRLLLE